MTDKKLLVQEVSSAFTMLLRLVYQAFEEICAASLEDDQEQILLNLGLCSRSVAVFWQ